MKNRIIKNKYFIIIIIFSFLFLLYFLYFKFEQKVYVELKNNIKYNLVDKSKKEIDEYNEKIKYNKNFLKNIDLKIDSSITKFVSAKVPFNNISYTPTNLVNISTNFIIDGKGGGQKLRIEAKQALNDMAKAYYRDTGEKIIIVSAYRSYLYQKGIKDRGCPDNLCAKAGYSEHQTGLTIDLWSASSYKYWQKEPFISKYNWLKNNAYKYGFHNTYQKGLKIDTYEIEPWHWRYLGKSLAKYLWENNLTFAEFYNKMEQN